MTRPSWRQVRARLAATRVAGPLRGVVEPVASFAVIRLSGLFDADWYRAQRPPGSRPLRGSTPALAHYVRRGRRAGLAPHPLFEPSWFAPSTWRDDPADPFARFLLRGRERRAAPHPLFEPERWQLRHPEAAEHRFGPFGHFAANADGSTVLPVRRGASAGGAGPAYATARTALAAALAGWQEDERRRRAVRAVPALPDIPAALPARALPDPVAPPVPAVPSEPGGPMVSVVMAVRDREAVVGRAVASVQAQTYPGWELIVVDDGSVDGTAAVVDALVAGDDRIRLLRTAATGVGAARNAGAAQARGRYVTWLDSDNVWSPGFLASTVAAMAPSAGSPGRKVAHAAVEIVAGDGTRTYRAVDPHATAPGDPRGEALALLGASNFVDLNVLVVERELLDRVGGFDESLRRTVDHDLVWRLAELPDVDAVPHLVPVVGVTYTHDRTLADRISVREPAAWREVVRNRHLIDWTAVRAGAATRPSSLVSVLVPATSGGRADAGSLAAAVWRTALSALDQEGVAVEVVVTDDALPRGDTLAIAALPLVDARAKVHRVAKPGDVALATNLAFARSGGGLVVVLDPGVELDAGALAELAATLSDPDLDAATPLLVAPDATVASAGTGAADRQLFRGLAPDDARRAGRVLRVRAPAHRTARALAVRAVDLAAVGGLDCLAAVGEVLDDVVERIGRLRDGARHRTRPVGVATAAVALVPAPVGTGSGSSVPPGPGPDPFRDQGSPVENGSPSPDPGDIAADAALEATAGFAPGARARLPRPPGPASPLYPGGAPRLRWAIKISAPLGPVARRWGDLHFARALGAALERLGQDVVVDRRPALGRDDHGLDDVTLVLRGLFPADPPATSARLLWVISHPDLVTAAEAAGYDVVLAAGPAWARDFTARSGLPVTPLLQATDPAVFFPDPAVAGTGEPVLLVGNARGVFRPVLRHLLEAGIDVGVHGAGWEPYVDPRHVRSPLLATAEVAEHYRRAGVVLNDHWDDMRAGGFLSNRLFDAAASGARVVSDDVDGAEELFGGLVRTYRTPAELVDLVRRAGTLFPDAGRRADLAAGVAREHSFDARALALLELAVPLVRKTRSVQK